MAIHHVAVPAKNGAGQDIPGGVRQHDTSGTNAGPNVPELVFVDSTGAEVIGTQADSSQSDPAQSASLIAFIKGWLTLFGQKTDVRNPATDGTNASAISLFKQISFSAQAIAAALGGTLTVGTHAVTGSGNFSTTVNDGGNLTLGTKADARNTATDGTPLTAMSIFKQISFSIQSAAASLLTLVTNTPAPGRQAAFGSSPVALSNEDKTALDLLATNQSSQITQETALNTVLGVRSDPKASQTDTTSVSIVSVFKQISFSIQQAAAALVSATVTPSGYTAARINSSASTNPTLLKSTAGNIGEIDVFNTAAYTVYLKFYNRTSIPTAGTDAVFWTVPIASNGGYSKSFEFGKSFTNGIAYAITKLQADSDNTPVAAGDLTGSIDWI